MSFRRILATAAALTTAGSVTLLAPSARAADTTATVTLEGGSLSISAPSSASATASVAPGSAISVSVGTSTVTDNRGSLLGWTVTGTASDLTYSSGGTTYTIPKAGLTWATGTIATTNGLLTGVSAGAGGTMAASFPVAVAVATAGSGTYTYPATITGVVPVGLKAGAYTGTVTQSIA